MEIFVMFSGILIKKIWLNERLYDIYVDEVIGKQFVGEASVILS